MYAENTDKSVQSQRKKLDKMCHYRPMSLIFSPGSKGGSSISANLLDSLRTWIGKERRRQEKKQFFIQRLIFNLNFN